MHYKFSSETTTDDGNSQLPQSPTGFLGMMYGENEGLGFEAENTQTETQHNDTLEEQELQPQSKKCSRVSKTKSKSKKKSAAKSKSTPTDLGESSDEEEGTKRGPNWKEHWIINLIHLRGKMHDKFSGMKKQGVDNLGVLHTQLVAICPDFDRSSDACCKKWKKMYDDYKSDYTANGISGNERSSKCKYYSVIDSYMHERANVFKHVHASANDEDPNSVQDEGEEDLEGSMKVPQHTASSSQGPVGKKSDKLATQEAIACMAEQAVKLTDAVTNSEAAKVQLLQGMLATMNELVKKL